MHDNSFLCTLVEHQNTNHLISLTCDSKNGTSQSAIKRRKQRRSTIYTKVLWNLKTTQLMILCDELPSVLTRKNTNQIVKTSQKKPKELPAHRRNHKARGKDQDSNLNPIPDPLQQQQQTLQQPQPHSAPRWRGIKQLKLVIMIKIRVMLKKGGAIEKQSLANLSVS